MISVHIITGQTGTGKTGAALALAKKTNADIISVDSRQLYQKLDIVTGKDIHSSPFSVVTILPFDGDREITIGYYLLDGIRLWGCDLIDPKTQFSSHDYKAAVKYIVENTIDAATVPIIVGGSYLYLKDLLYDFDIQVPPNTPLREELADTSVDDLQKKLEKINKSRFEQMNDSDKKNPHRLIRKIEIATAEKGGRTSKKSAPMIKPLTYVGYSFKDNKEAELVIRGRIQERMSQGALREVADLLDDHYSPKDPGLRTIGYTQLIAHIQGEISLNDALEQWLRAEISYAKRQLTFMKKDAAITWHLV